jgi:hypothetical protein
MNLLSNINFELEKFQKKKLTYFLFLFIIMRINPTTSGPGVSALEKKNLVHRSNHWPSARCSFSPGQDA